MAFQLKTLRPNQRFCASISKRFAWLAACVLAGLIASAVLVGCRSNSEGDVWSRMPKLSPRPLVIPQVWNESFDKAREESAATGKPILANFTGSDWCSYCVKLKSEVFETEAFGNWAKENVILLELDFPKRSVQSAEIVQQNQALRSKFAGQIKGFPTVLFLDSQGNLIKQGPGYMNDPQAWIEQANAALGQNK